MSIYWDVLQGDCRAVLAEQEPDTFDACVTDPPYELGFMGKDWDRSGVAVSVDTWAAVLRVLKPGAHIVAFGGTRTWHRIACAIEDAGFQIRDNLAWLYGQGFPKSLNLPGGVGTALKPSFEPVILARKPLIGTVAANVVAHGTGGLQIDASRMALAEGEKPYSYPNGPGGNTFSVGVNPDGSRSKPAAAHDAGRWPPNVMVDEDVAADLDATNGAKTSGKMAAGTKRAARHSVAMAGDMGAETLRDTIADTGGVSRYFYCPKANAKERDAGLEHWPTLSGAEATGSEEGQARLASPRTGAGRGGNRKNPHPTVKPIALMRWLCKLITPPGGVVLDPFLGSGSTGCAAGLEGFDFLGVELGEEYARLARDRITAALAGKP